MNLTIRGVLSTFLLFPSAFWRSVYSLFCPLRSSPFLSLSLGFSTSSIAARVSSAFMYFYAFRSISAIVRGGFFASETMNSLELALKVVNCTLSFTSSTSKVSRVKRFMYDLRVSFSPCLIVSKWSASLFGHCPPTKWHKKELLSYSKSSMDEVGNFVNHFLATLLRVAGKERYNILSGGY